MDESIRRGRDPAGAGWGWLMAYGVLGFAVMHSVTRGLSSRGFVLAGVYASVLIFGWPVLALCIIGLSETFFHFRARAAVKRGPPAST